jgi:hypothetical protein
MMYPGIPLGEQTSQCNRLPGQSSGSIYASTVSLVEARVICETDDDDLMSGIISQSIFGLHNAYAGVRQSWYTMTEIEQLHPLKHLQGEPLSQHRG